MSDGEKETQYLLVVGVDEESLKILEALDKGRHDVYLVPKSEDFMKLVEETPERPFVGVIAGNTITEVNIMEVAQTLKGLYAELPLMYLSSDREGFDAKNMIKNGFDDAFLLPPRYRPL